MGKSKQLPYIKPPFTTYQDQAGSGVAAMQIPTILNWYYNNVVILSCGKEFLTGYTSPDLQIDEARVFDMPFLESIYVRRDFSEGYEIPIIKNMLNRGFFVHYTVIDPYYVDGILWGGEKHTLHDGIICGYDDNDMTFTFMGYDNRWNYGCFRSSQEGFQKALVHGMEIGGGGGFFAFKPYDVNTKFELDAATAINKLEKYLSYDPNAFRFDSEGRVKGILVHDYLALYLTYLSEGIIPYEKTDRRIMRMIVEHKQCMAGRFAAFEKALNLSADISEKYKQVTESAIYAKTLYDRHRIKRRDDYLVLIKNEIIKIKKLEEELIPKFLKKIKET